MASTSRTASHPRRLTWPVRRLRGRVPRPRGPVRRGLRVVTLVVAVLAVPVVWSYVGALAGPGTDSVRARTVEWAREHDLGFVVDRLEKWWFASHQAAVGGNPDLAAGPEVISEPASSNEAPTATQPAATDPSAPGSSSPTGTGSGTAGGNGDSAAPTTSASSRPGHLELPAPLVTPAATPVDGEGQWRPLGPAVGGVQGAYVTSIRPDADHTSVLDAVVWFDPTVLSLREYPGTKIPGSPWDRPDHVEPDRAASLVAAFSGGFRIQDSRGGMILGGRTLQKMRVGAATFSIDDNGMPNIGAWGTDITPSGHLDSARQNLDPIVVDGAPAPDLGADPNRKWGFTGPANHTAVWRSGAGVRPDGSLVWVGGNGLTIEALAETLVRAGCVRGMQLDINQEWVTFNTYATVGGRTHGKNLLRGMAHPGDRWLTEDTRDFFAVFTRATS